jgi:hypothetical protein
MDQKMSSTRNKVTIDSLPPEVLVEIVKFVPKKQHKDVALTSKKFYEAICEIEKFKFPLKITHEKVNV